MRINYVLSCISLVLKQFLAGKGMFNRRYICRSVAYGGACEGAWGGRSGRGKLQFFFPKCQILIDDEKLNHLNCIYIMPCDFVQICTY